MNKVLNVNITNEETKNLERFCKETGYSKAEVVTAALQLFIKIKQEEMDYRAVHPTSYIKSRIIFEVKPQPDGEPRMASVLMY